MDGVEAAECALQPEDLGWWQDCGTPQARRRCCGRGWR